ncbi:unnamed protein product [Mytilus coruscus]|uniref:Uncharacterized protein n=1 Tax=Mytilus coruscus TaxID=42192 RepID=A0A6J8C9I9_MYTCO|nr:unnamed protein product [Mytilus coruscus]
MSKKTNCFKIHPERESGPCIHCERHNDRILLKEEPLLLPNTYEQFKQYLLVNIAKFQYVISETDLKKLQHNNKWIFRMLKIRFSKTAISCLPDIHAFDAKHEINQIPQVLWNFLYRLSATDKEDKEFIKTVGSWDHHYIETPFNVNRAFPRLYTCSCIFNCQNAQCVQPLHLLVTDICDKFSNASSTFLSINARLGLGVSKDSLRRYITNRCRQLEQQQRFLTSDSFVVASFDNLDKNQSYSVVGVGKDKSGFHGTTIQAVTPCPSLLTSISSAESCGTGLDDSAVPLLVGGISSEASVITSDIDSSSCEVDLISSAIAFVDKVSTCTELSRDRSLTCDFIQSIVNPDDKIGTPRSSRGNQFENLTASYLDVSPREAASFTDFTDLVHRYGFTKCLLHDKQIQIPGIKTFLSIPSEKTEKSDFTSVAVLDDTADKKETVLKVLNTLHDKFEIGKSCNYIVVVVGDGKNYDHLIKLKNGIPEKGQKSWATSVFKKMYPVSFISSLPPPPLDTDTAYIIDGMFIINTIPLSVHKTFLDYAGFLFDKWVVRPHFQFKATEVHLVFDHPNRQDTSPKDIERSRRDITNQTVEFDQLSPDTDLPSNWRSFLSVRKQKRLLVNFISDQFLTFANQKFSNSECSFITAGGFDNQFKDQARFAIANTSIEYMIASGDHEEADTRVWLHAVTSTAQTVIIYSPDTDVYFIGLPLVKNSDKSLYVQLKDSPYEKLFISMNEFSVALQNDICFQGIQDIESCIQLLYIYSGCDYVSYFKGFGKKTFLMYLEACFIYHWYRNCMFVRF